MSRNYNAGDEPIQDSIHEELEAERAKIESAMDNVEKEPVNGEVAGTGDGAQTTFTLANSYVSDSTKVYNAGSRTVDYSESDPSAGEITFNSAPGSGNAIVVDYRQDLS